MRFLIRSAGGDGSGLAYRLLEEGNEVTMFIKDPSSRAAMDGIVPKVATLDEGLNQKPDVVIYDMSGSGEEADSVKKRGFRVVGSSQFCDLLELDRAYAMNLAKKLGILVPEFKLFRKDQMDEARFHVEQTGQRMVLKPAGNAALDLTYVSKGPEDMIQELEWVESKGLLKDDFLLQEFVEGIELSTECWFSDGDPVPQLCNGTIERKKLMTGDKGPATGSESSVCWRYDNEESKIITQTVKKIYRLAKEFKYTGPIDINSIVRRKIGPPGGNENNAESLFLEFTPRLGYSAFYALCELIDCPIGDFFYGLATRNTADLGLKEGVGMAVTVSIHPYPIDTAQSWGRSAAKVTEGKKIENVPDDGFYPYDLKSDGGDLVTAGTLGLICYVTAHGDDLAEAEDAVYAKVDSMSVPDAQYRLDGAGRAEKEIPLLKEMGYDVPEICKLPEREEPTEDRELELVSAGEEEDD